jgi:hypothetical protein
MIDLVLQVDPAEPASVTRRQQFLVLPCPQAVTEAIGRDHEEHLAGVVAVTVDSETCLCAPQAICLQLSERRFHTVDFERWMQSGARRP